MSSRPPLPGAEYSVGSRPTPRRKQPRLSAPPVTSAICGRSPSERFAGSRVSDEPASGVWVHALTVGRNTSRRHLPICTTSGTCEVAGMPVSVKVPSAFEVRSEEHTSELQSHVNLVCRLLLEKKKK